MIDANAHDQSHTAGATEAAEEVGAPKLPFHRREPVLTGLAPAGALLGVGLVDSLRRDDRELSLLLGALLVIVTALGLATRQAVTPVALPRRDADSPLIDPPPELLA